MVLGNKHQFDQTTVCYTTQLQGEQEINTIPFFHEGKKKKKS